MQIPAILNDMTQNHFLLDGSYPHFYFLTLDHVGEVGAFQLCQPDVQEQLNKILSENLLPPSPAMPIEHDALEQDGSPVLFSYLCDLPRLHRFRCALTLHNQTGSILCFDYQAEALREAFGAQVNITSIDFAAYERVLLHQ